MYKPTIGLEIHMELDTKSKMFCSCKNNPNEKRPNVNICPICMGHPGTLPVINKEAVKKVIKTAQALNCKIQKNSFFERKNYFYPDLPKGYQISQYALPLGKNGQLDCPAIKTRIERIHLEEDTGRLTHPNGKNYSLIDFNRAGIPLMELVTEPEMDSAKEARDFVRELQLIVKYLGVSKANMEKGEMRAEVNISLFPQEGQNLTEERKLGTKVEIKNLNSLRAVEKAIEYEINRQSKILESGGKISQETRGWDAAKEITFPQRKKEESNDYRYFPEPDLPPLEFTEEFLKKIKAELPELPQQKRKRFKEEYFLSGKEIEFYISQKALSEYFEKVISELNNWIKEKEFEGDIKKDKFKKLVKLASNYISSDLQGLLSGARVDNENFLISPENFAEFLSMIYKKEISSKIAKILLKEMFSNGADPSQIIKEKKLSQINRKGDLKRIIKIVINNNPKAVGDYKKGKKTALQFLFGKVMAETKGKANPTIVGKLLQEFLP